MFFVVTTIVHFTIFPLAYMNNSPDELSSTFEPLEITLITTSLDDSSVRYIPCGEEVTVHAFVNDRNGILHKEKLPDGYQIKWNCHMRIHPICNVRGRNQLTAVFYDLNCGQRFSPLIEIYNEDSNYVKHESLKPIQIGPAAKNCSMEVDCVENCDKELDPGKEIELHINGLREHDDKAVFGVAMYSGINGDLLYLGASFWKFTIKTSQIPFYYKYKIIVSIKSSVLNESCSGLYQFAFKKLFSVGIITNPPAPLRYEGPRLVKCGTKCIALTPYCIHGWLVNPNTCGLKWMCNDAVCGVTEGSQLLLLRNLPCGSNVTVRLTGDPLVRAAHARERKIYEWNRSATVVLQVGHGNRIRRQSALPKEPITSQSWISSTSGLPDHWPLLGLRVLVDEASNRSCSNPAPFRPESLLLDPSLTPPIVISKQ